jgi:hypothetical protein
MNREFIPYEEALALKELGFNEPCRGFYDADEEFQEIMPMSNSGLAQNEGGLTDVAVPLYQQAFRWFREKYKLHSYVHNDYSWNISGGIWDLNEHKDSRYDWDSEPHKTYEEAELECLKQFIKIVKEKK